MTVANPHKLLGRNASHPSAVNYFTGSYYGLSYGTNHRGGIDVVFPLEDTGSFLPPYPEAHNETQNTPGLFTSLSNSLFGSNSKPATGDADVYPPANTNAFSAEELTAQLFEHIKEFTESFAGMCLSEYIVYLFIIV